MPPNNPHDMHTREKLDEVLEKRAIARVNQDLLKLFKFINDTVGAHDGPRLFVAVDEGEPPLMREPTTLFFMLKYERRSGSDHVLSSPFMDKLRADMLPRYRDQVIKEFMDKVDSLELQEPNPDCQAGLYE